MHRSGMYYQDAPGRLLFVYAKDAAIRRFICASTSKIIESSGRDIDEHALNEWSALGGSLHRVFDAAFPFENCPTRVADLRQLRENTLEVNLSISQAAESTGAVPPVLVATVDTRFCGGVIFGVLYVERFDMIFVDIDIANIIQLL